MMSPLQINVIIRKVAVSVAFLLFFIPTLSAGSGPAADTFSSPDFAFPQTVDVSARMRLNHALATGEQLDALQAGVQITIARTLVSPDSLASALQVWERLRPHLKGAYSSLGSILEARLLTDAYRANRYVYDNRLLPPGSNPENPLLWSRDIYLEKIKTLIEEAISNKEGRAFPLSKFKPLILNTEQADLEGMVLFDFISRQGISMLNNFGLRSNGDIIPFFISDTSDNSSIDEGIARNILRFYEEEDRFNIAAGRAMVLTASFLDQEERIRMLYDSLMNTRCGVARLPIAEEYFNQYIYPAFCDGEYEQETQITDAVEGNKIFIQDTFTPAQFYEFANQLIALYPDFGKEILTRPLSLLTEENYSYILPQLITAGDELEFKINSRNKQGGYLLLIKIPRNEDRSLKVSQALNKGSLVNSYPLPSSESVIPFNEQFKLTVPNPGPGTYVALFSNDNSLSGIDKSTKSQYVTTFNVSSINVITSEGVNNGYSGSAAGVFVVDAVTMEPIKGAKVTLSALGKNKSLKKVFITDNEGFVGLPREFVNCQVTATYKGSKVQIVANTNRTYNPSNRAGFIEILTDLSIYHPGDEVQFSVISYLRDNDVLSVYPEKELIVSLIDANGNAVKDLRVSTDKYGRGSGSFILPEEGLLGQWGLEGQFKDKGKYDNVNRAYFSVAEYKAPSFMVSLEKEKNDILKSETETFEGSVVTFSGMPVAGAEVKYEVSFKPFFYRRNSSPAFYGGETVTDEKGDFSISLPLENLRNTRYEYGLFSIKGIVTSQEGETVESNSVNFSLRKSFTINPSIPSRVEIDSTAVVFNIVVCDISGFPVKQLVNFKLLRKGNGDEWSEIKQGRFSSPILTLPSEILQSGSYKLVFDLEEVQKISEFIVFRADDKIPPVETTLWLPQDKIYPSNSEKKVAVKVGNSHNDDYILCVISDKTGILSRKWVRPKGEIIDVSAPVPQKGNRVWVNFCSSRNFNTVTSKVTVYPPSAEDKLSLFTETFRDKVTAGSKEQWKFKFNLETSNGGQNPGMIPVMAVMTNKALDSLKPFKWYFNPTDEVYLWNNAYLNSLYKGSVNFSADYTKNFGTAYRYAIPEWNFYDYTLYPSFRNGVTMRKNIMIRGTKSSSTQIISDDKETFSVEEVYLTGAVSDLAMTKVEYAEAEMVDEMASEAGSGGEEIKYRETECPLAFFYPDLVSNEEGIVSIDFEVPNFNTTWKLQVLGYTPEMQTVIREFESLASKPVMVQTNLPMFLRTYDTVILKSAIYNNSDKERELNGNVEVINGLDGKVIASEVLKGKRVSPSSSLPLDISFKVPSETSVIIFRIKGWSEVGSDGEQMAISILPASQPVVEANNFYLQPGQSEFTYKLPSLSSNSAVTLKYCDNPIWYVMTALPGLIDTDSQNATNLVESYFASATSYGLISSNPSLREALTLLFDKSKDKGLLESNLLKDSEQRILTLGNTPWVNNAFAEQLRLSSLSNLLDDNKAQKQLNQAWNKLESLRLPGSGWSWCPKMEPSFYITTGVLIRLGRLLKTGYMKPDKLQMKAIEEAIAFADADLIEDYRKNGDKISLAGTLYYLYARSFFRNDSGSAEFLSLRTKMMSRLRESWRKMDISDKATSAILFSRYDDKTLAKTICESLSQFSTYQPSQGRWFDNIGSDYDGKGKLATTARVLEAYNEILPDSDEINQIRQWLILQRRGEDWGSKSHLSELVQTILTSGEKWNSEGLVSEIFLGNEKITPQKVDVLSGMITLNLSSKNSRETLRIVKKSEGPSWGGLLSQFTAPIQEIKRVSTPEIAVSKELLVVETNNNGAVIQKNNTLRIGDKVRITMTVENSRDLNYVILKDERAACFIPTMQISDYLCIDGVWTYKEIRDSSSTLFFTYLPKGKHVFSYDCYVTREGEYSSGTATVQSQYSPMITAHSAGAVVKVE